MYNVALALWELCVKLTLTKKVMIKTCNIESWFKKLKLLSQIHLFELYIRGILMSEKASLMENFIIFKGEICGFWETTKVLICDVIWPTLSIFVLVFALGWLCPH